MTKTQNHEDKWCGDAGMISSGGDSSSYPSKCLVLGNYFKYLAFDKRGIS